MKTYIYEGIDNCRVCPQYDKQEDECTLRPTISDEDMI